MYTQVLLLWQGRHCVPPMGELWVHYVHSGTIGTLQGRHCVYTLVLDGTVYQLWVHYVYSGTIGKDGTLVL